MAIIPETAKIPTPSNSSQNLSQRLGDARERFRQVRRGLHHPFRKTKKFSIEIIPSPFTDMSDNRTVTWQPPEESIPSSSSSSMSCVNAIMDGPGEKRAVKGRSFPPVSAIFIHAGAGYHSMTNESIHLGACADAAKLAMKILRSGGTAVDAVEAAIKVLEDKEITNAGYGSNLSIDGIVECDATIVDHLGRSGACGATAKIKNPINLARLILDVSSRPLSLRRVPPNLLVGEGASDFAWEHGMSLVPHDAIVSKTARERFIRWREDLKRAGGARTTPDTASSTGSEEVVDLEYEDKVRNKQRRDHFHALLNAIWNEGQPDSPQPRTPEVSSAESTAVESPLFYLQSTPNYSPILSTSTGTSYLDPVSPIRQPARSPVVAGPRETGSPSKRPKFRASQSSDGHARTHSLLGPSGSSYDIPKASPDVMLTGATDTSRKRGLESNDGPTSPVTNTVSILEDDAPSLIDLSQSARTTSGSEDREDMITDTVGAIAIDMFGNIAAGSSSGGIGMKHRGRVGPAALVGIGTAVIPEESDSPGVSVAAVTSGTGEHMATTMASQKCAERLFYNTRRTRGGTNLKATEEEAIESFIKWDFMDHPGVKHSHSAGAIGVMAVKKSLDGYYLYFAHNTDSFALASMHSNEKEPKCVMSRIGNYESVVQGGRRIRLDTA